MRAKNSVPIFLLALCLTLSGCTVQPPDQDEPPAAHVGTQQAIEAISDIHLISLQALYEMIAGRDVAEGRLIVSMYEGASVATGEGRFALELSHYALPSTSPLSSDYHGYVITGGVEIDSEGYAGTFGGIEVTLRHENPRRYPVERIEAQVIRHSPGEAVARGGGVAGVAGVRLFVNGRRMPEQLLTGGR
ncbi:MAG: hypothetical protein ACLFP4_00940 [Spirochaetales bacterium]